jgi:hypothetical protein
MDDGNSRPGCLGASTNADCYSRAVAYALDETARTASLVWQSAYPVSRDDASSGAVRSEDLYDYDGGSISRLGDDRYVVGYTSTAKDGSGDFLNHSYVFEVDATDGEKVYAKVQRTSTNERTNKRERTEEDSEDATKQPTGGTTAPRPVDSANSFARRLYRCEARVERARALGTGRVTRSRDWF